MLRILLESNARRVWFGEGAFVSIATHAALIALAVTATTDNSVETRDRPESERVIFMIPPNRSVAPPPQELLLSYHVPGLGGGNDGFLDGIVDKKATTEGPVAGRGRDEGKSEKVEVEQPPVSFSDTVVTAIEADSAVTRYPESAAPAYPPALLEQKIEGSAYVQFIVDTTGLVDTSTFKVLVTNHPDFAVAVREALPFMRFHPAVLRSQKVRQLVEQPFMFKIVPPAPPVPAEIKPSS